MSDETSTHQGQGEIIIVKKVQGGGGGHHGGAWKIAYADFVTAMMAFFLVMWLVNAANEDTKASVASYFNPIKLTDQQPSEKGVKKAGETAEGEKTPAASKSEGDEKTTGDGKADGQQETSTAGEEAENSEADYFENPYAVLAEIVMDTGEDSNISEKGEGGAQNSGSATGASGGEAYRDPFDPDFWNKQVTNSPDAVAALDMEAQSQDEGDSTTKSGSPMELDMGAGDVFDKTAGAGDDVNLGAAISDHDTGGDKTALAPFEGDEGGQEFEFEGKHISDLAENDKSSSTLPPGPTSIEDIDPNKLATLFEEGKTKLDNLRQKGAEERLSGEEQSELLALMKARKSDGLGPEEQEKLGMLLAKNEGARKIASQAALLQKDLDMYEEQLDKGQHSGAFMASAKDDMKDGMSVAAVQTQEGLSDAEKLKQEIKTALGGTLGKLSEGLEVNPAEGGLLLSLTDQENIGMFNVGSAIPKRDMVLLMEKIGNILNEKNGALAIRGHTDARAFSSGGNDNWRLSMARAHSAYFMLVRGGIPEERITQVSGFADRRLKVPEDPYSKLNRRIEILIEMKDEG
jgi:flagellar motor protein MotB